MSPSLTLTARLLPLQWLPSKQAGMELFRPYTFLFPIFWFVHHRVYKYGSARIGRVPLCNSNVPQF